MSIDSGNRDGRQNIKGELESLFQSMGALNDKERLQALFAELKRYLEIGEAIGILLRSPLLNVLRSKESVRLSDESNKKIYILTRIK